jgi:NAD-dependent deacetylase sirtuin 5
MSDSVEDFTSVLHDAKKIVVLSGAGISAESGIPTFRGEGGLWRAFDATELATPGAFAANPSLVWEFYHYRRTIVARAAPNAGHYAVAALQRRCRSLGKDFTLLTQNIDGLHIKAGSTDVVELHGSLWKTRCCHCKAVETNTDMPICPALDGKGAPDITDEANIPSMELPRCKKCNGLLRPHVVWFGECLERSVVNCTDDALQGCDLLLVVGTSAVVYPAAGYAPIVKAQGGVVAEFNTEDTPISCSCRFKFQGPSSVKLPLALGIGEDELAELKEA